MDVVQSDFAFMPNKLDLIRDIALGTDNAERKAYSNNKYGLVEYSIRSGYVKISYKNRNGVRKEGALDWRELYEILSYGKTAILLWRRPEEVLSGDKAEG